MPTRRRSAAPSAARRSRWRWRTTRASSSPRRRAMRRRSASTGRRWCRRSWSSSASCSARTSVAMPPVERAGRVRERRRRGGRSCRAPPAGPTRALPLGTICGARSGDKGGNANVGLWVRSPQAYAWLDALPDRRALPRAASPRPRPQGRALPAAQPAGAQLRRRGPARRRRRRLAAPTRRRRGSASTCAPRWSRFPIALLEVHKGGSLPPSVRAAKPRSPSTPGSLAARPRAARAEIGNRFAGGTAYSSRQDPLLLQPQRRRLVRRHVLEWVRKPRA